MCSTSGTGNYQLDSTRCGMLGKIRQEVRRTVSRNNAALDRYFELSKQFDGVPHR
jgi:hypothetical protein